MVGRTKVMILVGAAAIVASLAMAPGASTTPTDARLQGVHSWAFAIGNHTLDGGADGVASRYAPFDLVVADGEEATPAEVASLRAEGKVVLAYLSVGTIEKWRSWYPKLKRFRLQAWKDWKDEWFAKVKAKRYRHVITSKVTAPILDKGFDGLFLDNTDMIETHHGQTRGMRKLIHSLSRIIDDRRGLLFAQNGFDVLGPVLQYLDGWNREDVTWTYDFDHRRYVHQKPGEVAATLDELRSIGSAGLLVTATDYTKAGDAAAGREAVANACSAGALPYVSDIGLRRVPGQALVCP
jgi:cysteinyl-tRNA synthetase